MSDIADVLKRMDSYRWSLPISGQSCLDELSNAVHDLKVENDNQDSEITVLRDVMLNPNPDSEPDNVRLHREKCDTLTKLWAAQRDLHDGRFQLVKAHEALKPFAQIGWLTYDTEHTNRTVIAHMHPERECEIILSSDDFRRAKAAITDDHQSAPGEEAIKAAANEAAPGAQIVRRDGDLHVYYAGFNLSKFVRFLALTYAYQPMEKTND